MTLHKWAARSLLLASAVIATPAYADDGFTVDERGIVIGDRDTFELNIGGRLHVDGAWINGPVDSTDVDLRRARIEVGGRIAKIFRFRVDREFSHGGGWRNVWASIEPVKDLELRVGNQVVPFSLEEAQSSNTLPLMERSHVSVLAPGLSKGVMLSYGQKNFSVAGGYFGDALDAEDSRSATRGKGFAGRATFAPMAGKSNFLHFGLGLERRNVDLTDIIRLTAKPGVEMAPTLIRTGSLVGIDKLRTVNAEAAFGHGNMLLQGQVSRQKLKSLALADPHFNAWYVQGSVVVTGEDYEYSGSSGAIRGVDVGKKGGAIEVAARLSGLDLDDTLVNAGKATTATVGANYYINRNLRVMVDLSRSKSRSVGVLSTGEKWTILGARLQAAF